MRLTMRGDYGAHAIIELARHYGGGPLQSAEIAARQKIPEAFLDQLLCSLRRAGMVRSVRGPRGGHELARDPRSLTLGEVVTALEGPVAPREFVHVPVADGESADWLNACAVRNAWLAAAEASQQVLDGISIQELAEQQSRIRTNRELVPRPEFTPIAAPRESAAATAR